MPELPEVETTVRGLRKKVLKRTIFDIWTDTKKMIHLRKGTDGKIKKTGNLKEFKRETKGRKILKIWRRGKNIVFDLSGRKSLLIHQKMTGHLLHGTWSIEHGTWKPRKEGPLEEKINTYIHLLFTFEDGQMLALSDLRKFAKIELWDSNQLKKELGSLGPEALDKNLTFEKFKEVLLRARGKIKQVLMNQKVIAGIGNIYSSEILWEAKVSPFKDIKKLRDEEIKEIYKAMGKVLKKAIELRGTSISDYRDVEGKKGLFEGSRKTYQKEGGKCPRCRDSIKRKKIANRSTFFCPTCQK